MNCSGRRDLGKGRRSPRLAYGDRVLNEVLLLALGTLVAGPLGLWLQQGGRRARMRRRISDELGLIEKLSDFPDAQERLQWRAKIMLEQYETGSAAEAVKKRRLSLGTPQEVFLLLVVPVAAGMAVVLIWPDAPLGTAIIVMTLLSLGLNLSALMLETRKQDQAVEASWQTVLDRLGEDAK